MKNFGKIFFFLLTAIVLSTNPVLAYDYRVCTSDGCCCYDYNLCQLRPDHPDPLCRGGHICIDIDSYDCGSPIVVCECSPKCEPDIPTGSVQELPNGIDDDCDYYIDDEQCDEIDNDNDGMVDEDPGSCLLKVLFVPLDWQGTQQTFEETVQNQWASYIEKLGLAECPDNVANRVLNVSTDNLPVPDCSQDCGIDGIINSFRNRFGDALENDFNAVAFLTDHDICDSIAGCQEPGTGFIWVETLNLERPVLAHEFGHILGLWDEYCSRDAGSSDERCNDGSPPDPLNYLGADLGCNSARDQGCCGHDLFALPGFALPDCGDADCDYCPCCYGNKNSENGRCIMSYANAPGIRIFCDRCIQYIMNPPDPRSESNPNGQLALNCSLSHVGHQRILTLTTDISEQGSFSISHSKIGLGRLGLGKNDSNGRYKIEIREYSKNLIYKFSKNLSFGYDGPMFLGNDYSGIRYDKQTINIRVPIEQNVIGPLKITSFKDGEIVSASCLVAYENLQNGVINFSIDNLPPSITCPDDIKVECKENGGISSDSIELRPFFNYARDHTTDNCDSDPTVTNNAPSLLDIGSTNITFTATDADKNSASCGSSITVEDTVPPYILCPKDIVIQCDETVEPSHTGSATANDICDSNPGISFSDEVTEGTCSNGSQIKRNWTVIDDNKNSSSCMQTIDVVDTEPPVVQCNAPNTIKPTNAPVSFIASATDNCDSENPPATITTYQCKVINKGKIVDKSESCVVNIAGNKITILNTGGVANNISWTVTAVDDCGNSSQKICSVEIVSPRKK